MSKECISEKVPFSYYTVETGFSDEKRLTMLNELYNPSTTRFLLQSGLMPGAIVAEIGCGCGEIACWFAEQVGPKGLVFAIDNDPEQLKVSLITLSNVFPRHSNHAT